MRTHRRLSVRVTSFSTGSSGRQRTAKPAATRHRKQANHAELCGLPEPPTTPPSVGPIVSATPVMTPISPNDEARFCDEPTSAK